MYFKFDDTATELHISRAPNNIFRHLYRFGFCDTSPAPGTEKSIFTAYYGRKTHNGLTLMLTRADHASFTKEDIVQVHTRLSKLLAHLDLVLDPALQTDLIGELYKLPDQQSKAVRGHMDSIGLWAPRHGDLDPTLAV